MKIPFRNFVLLAFVSLVAACASTFATSYDLSVDPLVSRDWHLGQVDVIVPDALTVSEENQLVPKADIVWREDPEGDRKAQVAKIMKDAVTAGAAGLHGGKPIDLQVTVLRFHALTPRAEKLQMSNVGVLNVDFTIAVIDAATGATLVAPTLIQAALPGLTGKAAVEARALGRTQKTEISNHIRAVVGGWLGIAPDARRSFKRIGA